MKWPGTKREAAGAVRRAGELGVSPAGGAPPCRATGTASLLHPRRRPDGLRPTYDERPRRADAPASLVVALARGWLKFGSGSRGLCTLRRRAALTAPLDATATHHACLALAALWASPGTSPALHRWGHLSTLQAALARRAVAHLR